MVFQRIPVSSLSRSLADFERPLLGRLAYNSRSIPIQRYGNSWHLEPALAQRWDRLGMGIRDCTLKLLSHQGFVCQSFDFYAFPTSHGYKKIHDSAIAAR